MQFLAPTFQWKVLKQPKREGRTFSGNPRRVVRFCRREDDLLEGLCNGFFKTYALIPC
jgi:hypothetical protein